MKGKYNQFEQKIKSLLAANKVYGSKNQKPLRDWFMLLVGSTVLALVLVGVGLYLTISLFSQVHQDVAENERKLPLNKEHLAETLEVFEERANHFEYLRENPRTLDVPKPSPDPIVPIEEESTDEPVEEEE